jgi:hypothetical protein
MLVVGSTMLTFVRTVVALPGHFFEVIAAGKEVAAIVKRLFDQEVSVCSTLGGNLGEVSWIWQAASIEAEDEMDAKLMADAEYQAVYKKFGPLLVPNATYDRIYRHL